MKTKPTEVSFEHSGTDTKEHKFEISDKPMRNLTLRGKRKERALL